MLVYTDFVACVSILQLVLKTLNAFNKEKNNLKKLFDLRLNNLIVYMHEYCIETLTNPYNCNIAETASALAGHF